MLENVLAFFKAFFFEFKVIFKAISLLLGYVHQKCHMSIKNFNLNKNC